ncbi:hypothetical protein ACJRO7_026570 [Eucalyptus globulus]|uniref:Gag-pol polyprotein n=1 Tax=Eucalyptus globulus TaxID=34317 RepID=A0ABD3JPB5_EUCGL
MGDPSKSPIEVDPGKNNAVMTEVISSSSDRIIDKKLEGSANFHQWKKLVKLTLTGRNQHRHLTEFKPRDDVTWDAVDARILGPMLNSMESNVVDLELILIQSENCGSI